MTRRRTAGLALVALVALAGCGSAPEQKLAPLPPEEQRTTILPGATAPTVPPAPATPAFTVATALGRSVAVYEEPGQAEPARSLRSPQSDGSTLVLLVEERRPEWLKVLLPVRPNGVTGWIKAAEVQTADHDYRIEIRVSEHKLTVWKGNDVFLEETVAVGAPSTPTAVGTFYTTGLFETGSTQPIYGPYAYPLSGYSEVLFEFGGGDGQMGIHGTSDPSSLGRSVSNGCIRMSNASITKLAKTLPVGVPVEVKP